MRNEKGSPLFSTFISLATLVLVVMILRSAEEIMVPIAIAVLLAFFLHPLVKRLQRMRLKKTPAVAIAAILAFVTIGLIAWFVAIQGWGLIGQLPKYEENINAKIEKLKAPHMPYTLSRVASMVERSEKELSTPSPTDGHEPVSVRVEPTQKTPLTAIGDLAIPILSPLASALIVAVFMVALLVSGDDLRSRFIRYVRPTRQQVAHQVLSDASKRVFRYLTMQMAVNTGYGIVIGLGLFLIGIPQAPLWGLLAMLLRFIPFVGPWIGAAFPILLAVAVDPGWHKPVYAFALYLVAETLTGNLVEPMMYGSSTGISGIALLFAALFWTWLWGPAGLFLSTPLTVWLMVLGKYVPALRFLTVFLSSEPPRPVRKPPPQESAKLPPEVAAELAEKKA